jgi:hypothetical protein
VIFYGELYGAIYPRLECKSGLMPVQRGVYYSNDVHFSCFDIVVVRPSEKCECTDGEALVKLWQESKKYLVLVAKDTGCAEARSNLEAHCAKLDEQIAAGMESLAPTCDFLHKVLDGGTCNVMRDMPPCPAVVLDPHETMVSQSERCKICVAHGVPFAEILFRGAKDAAVAFSKSTRCSPTTLAAKHGMPEPYSEREGNVIRTDMPIYVGPRASLVVMKDKSPKFSEVAHSKHSKGSDDLKMEAPRFVTRNRLDNVVSKVEIGAPAVVLAQMLSEDALLDMKRKDQFVSAFAQQSDADMEEVQNILDTRCIALVAELKAQQRVDLENCIACDGGGMLLHYVCPLCEGEGGF